jgi:hypothetical protein
MGATAAFVVVRFVKHFMDTASSLCMSSFVDTFDAATVGGTQVTRFFRLFRKK